MKHPRKPGSDTRRASSADATETVRIWGIHAVEAALRNPARDILRLRLTENARNRLKDALAERETAPEMSSPYDLDKELGRDVVHQGALLVTHALPTVDIANIALPQGERGLAVVLDQVTDPHNVGAILRSAAAFGARVLVMTARNSPPLEGVLAKAASGGLELVPVAIVVNLARALEQLAEAGYFRIGLAGEGEKTLESQVFSGGTAIVLGSEESGMRRLTRENCDVVCRIETAGGDLTSLNVSNAAAVAMHAIVSQRTTSGR